jgi:hypothetical protein
MVVFKAEAKTMGVVIETRVSVKCPGGPTRKTIAAGADDKQCTVCSR